MGRDCTLLGVMNAEPILVSEVQTPTDGKTVVLIDSSASMSVESSGKSRFAGQTNWSQSCKIRLMVKWMCGILMEL